MSLPSEFAWLRSSLVEPRILSQTSLFEGCGSGEAASRLLARSNSNVADKNPRTYPPCVFQAYSPSCRRVTAADGLAQLSGEGPEATPNRSAFRELTGLRSFVMAPSSIRVFGGVRLRDTDSSWDNRGRPQGPCRGRAFHHGRIAPSCAVLGSARVPPAGRASQTSSR